MSRRDDDPFRDRVSVKGKVLSSVISSKFFHFEVEVTFDVCAILMPMDGSLVLGLEVEDDGVACVFVDE